MTFEEWVNRSIPMTDREKNFARFAWEAAIKAERKACANGLNMTRSEALLMAGEMTAQEWRTVLAVLVSLQSRMRSNGYSHD